MEWQSTGPGGGGGHFYPSISPADPDTIFLACPRGLMVTRDRGSTWERALGREMGFRTRPNRWSR